MSTYQDERVPFPSPGRLRRELRLRRPPLWMVAVLFVAVSLTWPPLALIARARVTFKDQPRVLFIQDMGKQPFYGPQRPSPVFEDGAAMRMPPDGTVRRAAGPIDRRLTEGMVEQADGTRQFARDLPAGLPLDERLLRRGQDMFAVYCAPCHGWDGYGHGPINERAMVLDTPGWTPAVSLHADPVLTQADGYLFSAITHGVRTMPPHGSMIRPEDRWAIVAYVRALQRSQRGELNDVPADARAGLDDPGRQEGDR